MLDDEVSNRLVSSKLSRLLWRAKLSSTPVPVRQASLQKLARLLDIGGLDRQTQNSEIRAVSAASSTGKGRRLNHGKADLRRNSDCCCITRATMLFPGASPRELATAGTRCLIVFAFLLQALLPVRANDAAGPSASQATATDNAGARAEEEPIYFSQAKDLPIAAGQVWSVAVSPDGSTLAVGSGMPDKPGALALWDASTKRIRAVVHEKLGIRSVAFSPDGKILATADSDSKTARLRNS